MSLKLAAWVTFICAILELFAGTGFNSMSLTTDAGYMFSDACALFMAILATKNINLRPYMLWLSSIMMLAVVIYMLNSAVLAINSPAVMQGYEVLIVSTIGLLVNIWVSKGLTGMQDDHNIQVAHLHVICDMLGSSIAVLSGLLAIAGFNSQCDIVLSIISALGVGLATLLLMYKMYTVRFAQT